MSGLMNVTVVAPVVIQPPTIPPPFENPSEVMTHHSEKDTSKSETESDSDVSSNEDESSDDDKHIADNPVLKERLRQLDRYTTPLHHASRSPLSLSDQPCISNLYAASVPVVNGAVTNGSTSVYGKLNGPTDVADSSSTPSEYRSHQLSIPESPNQCSGPASTNNSVTPKHNYSPPYGMLANTGNSGPSSQHDQFGSTNAYSQVPVNYNYKPTDTNTGYPTGHPDDSDGSHPRESNYPVIDDNQECVCEVCHAVYSNRSSLRSHMKKHTNHIVKRHQCNQCPYSTQYGKNLLKHMESMHMTEKSSQFRCEGCFRFFSSEISMRNHECLPTQCSVYRCEECGRVFKTKLRLKYHADIHNPRKPYVCDVEGCDRAFRTPKYLKNHRDEFHGMQPKNYLCPVEGCDLVFHRKTHLKRHVATHDDAEKKYQCQWPSCQRRFSSEETLNIHYRKHTGEKPFNCALCPFSCSNKPSLNEHYRLQHAKDTNMDSPFRSCQARLPQSPPLDSPHRLPGSFASHADPGPPRAPCRTPPLHTAASAVRHRMVDILESCGAQQPGPLDAEINGILDSLDKESDLPDLFSSAPFDFEHSDRDPRPPPAPHDRNLLSMTDRKHRSSTPNEHSDAVSFGPPEPDDYPSSGMCPSDQKDIILSGILSSVLLELQKADASGSAEEFERAKSNAIAALPNFSTGDKLCREIDDLTEQFLESISGQPVHVIHAVFHSTRPFSRDDMYMIESLEHQLIAEMQLTSPSPPRRRGRRPKLQQQIQPYLERIYSLEAATAEAMAAHLINAAQHERVNSLSQNASDFYSLPGCYPRLRGRGRGGRPRGRAGRILSLSGRSIPHEDRVFQTVTFRGGSITSRRIRGGIRGRYRLERSINPSERSVYSPDMENDSPLPGVHNLHAAPYPLHCEAESVQTHPTHFSVANQVAQNGVMPSDEAIETSMQLRAARQTSMDSDEELDELDEIEEGDEDEGIDAEYAIARRNMDIIARDERSMNGCTSMEDQTAQPDRSSSVVLARRENINQDSLGEMLEDLGVIVKRIGERAAAARCQSFQQESPSYGQPLNLTDYAEEDHQTALSVQSGRCGEPAPRSNRTEGGPGGCAIQLPSMATLASTSCGTPASTGGSTPGCLSNTDVVTHSPHLSSVPSLQHPASCSGPHGSNQETTPISDCHMENQTSAPGNLPSTTLGTDYKQPLDYHRTSAPMWSCESMCCPTTREACHVGEDLTLDRTCYSPETDANRGMMLGMYTKDDGTEHGSVQSYHPTDLSTRMPSYMDQSRAISSPASPQLSESHQDDMDREKSDQTLSYPTSLCSNAAAVGSFISAVEAVDHLRSLSALGAKYTASLNGSDEMIKSQDPYARHLVNIPYGLEGDDQTSPTANGSTGYAVPSPPQAHTPNQSHPGDMFTSPNMPSALNNLLCRDRKPRSLFSPPLNTTSQNPYCSVSGSPEAKLDFPPHSNMNNATNPNQLGDPYSSYHQTVSGLPSRCSSQGRPDLCAAPTGSSYTPLPSGTCTAACSASSCSSVASSSASSSTRSYMQDFRHPQHHQQQPLGVPTRDTRSPGRDLTTTRQLLSEAAATAYAHGLGRGDGQQFVPTMTTSNTSPRSNPYSHLTETYSPSPYNRYQHTESAGPYSHLGASSAAAEHGFHMGDFGASSTAYMAQSDPYNLYQQQLRQSSHAYHALSRSMDHHHHQPQSHHHQQLHHGNHAATHSLAHSIHEVSGLAAAEAAAAAAYAYRHYHHQQQQAQARHSLAMAHASGAAAMASSHYPHALLGPNARNCYNPATLEDNFSPRDLALYTAHSERRDPKSAYLAETYRSSHAPTGRFLF